MRVLTNCFDSHVHWLATGEHSRRLSLKKLKSPGDVRSLNVEQKHFRGEWLIGWGWDQNNWEPAEFPNNHILNHLFPDHPVAFFRADGHALWVNQLALSKISTSDLKKYGPDQHKGVVLRDSDGKPTGILIDHAMDPIKKLIPKPTADDVRNYLIEGMKLFNKQGFTHIRDLSCDETQWNQSVLLEQRGELTLAVEQYFDADPLDNFDSALALAKRARSEKTKLLKPVGIKVYYDGALGSEGALLSHPYRSGHSGLRLMTVEQFKDAAKKTWAAGFDIAIHIIGDQAAHEVAKAACEMWESGQTGRLHLEHAEMMRPESVKLLKGRNVVCHMQPCHWLTDRKWLHHKVRDLAKFAFPWALLEKEGIEFDFGSDSPIESPTISATLESLKDSFTQGIDSLKKDPLLYHEHPDKNWTPGTFTEIENGKPLRVQFQGKDITF